MRRFSVLCVLTFGTVRCVLFFYIVLFVCVHAVFNGIINDNNNKYKLFKLKVLTSKYIPPKYLR